MKLEFADKRNQPTHEQGRVTRATVLKVFAIIAVVTFVLRIFYAGYLYEDDGLWFTAAEEILRGKALYSAIYFDKPPALPLVYALLFWIFGAHILVIRLVAIVYSLAISAVLYRFGRRLYDERIGLIAAAMFTFFSTTSSSGHVQGLNTDFMMVLPYTAGAYFFIRSNAHSRIWFALAGGVLTGVATQINPKGIFDLIFFGLFLVWYRPPRSEGSGPVSLVTAALTGYALGSVPFLSYVAATHSLSAYWLYVWRWGARYAGFYPLCWSVGQGLLRSLNFFALNNTLLFALIFVVVVTIKRVWRSVPRWRKAPASVGVVKAASGPDSAADRIFKSDVTLLMWFVVSYAAVALGGRFFSHYFFQILPALCLLSARGLAGMVSTLKGRSAVTRRAVLALVAIGFAVTVVRFHTRTVTLAIDWARGTKSGLNAGWYHEVLNRESRMVAAVVRELPDGADAAERVGVEAIRAGGPRDPRSPEAAGPSDYLFVWGYAPSVYYWSGLLPATRYLSTQPLTGVPADVQYINGEHRSILEESLTAAARAQLLRDLEETQPKYIVDEMGFYNGALAILKYPDMQEVMDKYKSIGSTGRCLLYVRRDLTKKFLLRHSIR